VNGHDFDRFVDEGTDSLLRAAYLIVGDLHEAEDLVQETLFKVAKRWPKVSRMDYPAAYAVGSWSTSRCAGAPSGRAAGPN
jgi:DNA-directed RNA polymerase specialized sigma24 family protein